MRPVAILIPAAVNGTALRSVSMQLENFQNRSLLTADVTVSIDDFLNPMVDVYVR